MISKIKKRNFKVKKNLSNAFNNMFEKLLFYENNMVINKYKDFVGDNDLDNLVKNFSLEEFSGCWDLVLTSPSTELLGTGIDYTSVRACYTIDNNDKNNVTLTNSGFNEKLQKTFIEGISEPRSNDLPTCRTVKFNQRSKFSPKGDYWITYYKKYDDGLKVLVVVAPLNIPYLGLGITPSFGFYTLVSSSYNCKNSHELFWSNKEKIKETLDYLNLKGFNKFWNKPVPSLQSLNYENQKENAILIA
jgi:hypothetical protein